MSILMQGNWTVSVKSKSAAFKQRFVISSADTGNGTYDGLVSTPPVSVTGQSWTITVQNNPGTGWIDSDDQIKFPTQSAGMYRFDIQSNDAGGDQDFNDLILTCSAPTAITEFLIYGNVNYYDGFCIFNPCSPVPYLVIDSAVGLSEALLRSDIRKLITKYYPQRIPKFPLPGRGPDPGPFRAMVLPLSAQALPTRQVIQASAEVVAGPAIRAEKSDAKAPTSQVAVSSTQVSVAAMSSSALAISKLVDHLRLRCQTGPLPGYALKFLQYDRTAAELAGGPYTGTGARQVLGTTVTDRNGNYIFRFTWSLGEYINEAFTDVASSEDVLVQVLPDIIVQVLDPIAPSGVAFESAPYWNIPNFRRINVCIPKGSLPQFLPCEEGLIIQRVGNITIGFTQPDGSRTTSQTFLGTEGRITNKSSLGPSVRCAAWWGSLYVYACLSNPEIQYYTIRYKKLSDPSIDWKFAKENLSLPRVTGSPASVVFEPVGWNIHTLEVDGLMQPAQAYRNIEVAPVAEHWLSSWVNLKMVLNSSVYQQEAFASEVVKAGPIQFRIEGYRQDGTKFPGADDTVTLYIDNNYPDRFIDPEITMIDNTYIEGDPRHTVTLGDCALFTLPTGQPAAPLVVKFRANQYEGFLDSYKLYMEKGSTGEFDIKPAAGDPAPYRTRSYAHGNDLACNAFFGTQDDTYYDFGSDEVGVDLTPVSSDGWLAPTQTFCAFSVNIVTTVRITDGQSVPGPFYATPVLIGIQK